MENKSRVRQIEFWDSAPSELDRLTYFSRLEDKEQRAKSRRMAAEYFVRNRICGYLGTASNVRQKFALTATSRRRP